MLFGYKNGKVQKLSIDSYDTKTNRRYLKNAYSDKSTIVDILYVEDDEDIALFRYADPDSYRLLIVNSSIIPEKSTRKASGVKTLRLKKGSEMIAMKKLKDLGVGDVERYYNDKLPRSGKKIDKLEVGQLLKHY
jgi:DNA gyrase subunit A